MLYGPTSTMIEAVKLTSLAQQVVAMRVLGMMGLRGGWSETQSENSRMVAEKPATFFRAWSAANHAALQGKSPDAVMHAYLRPLTTKASANRNRLAKRDAAVAHSC